jgi:hypothetical protein
MHVTTSNDHMVQTHGIVEFMNGSTALIGHPVYSRYGGALLSEMVVAADQLKMVLPASWEVT